uniref:Uncharacterized protein n=1 Tax=Anopheles atroparvus TaxID=41427 RepID=A0A182J1W7_ANOAO
MAIITDRPQEQTRMLLTYISWQERREKANRSRLTHSKAFRPVRPVQPPLFASSYVMLSCTQPWASLINTGRATTRDPTPASSAPIFISWLDAVVVIGTLLLLLLLPPIVDALSPVSDPELYPDPGC